MKQRPTSVTIISYFYLIVGAGITLWGYSYLKDWIELPYILLTLTGVGFAAAAIGMLKGKPWAPFLIPLSTIVGILHDMYYRRSDLGDVAIPFLFGTFITLILFKKSSRDFFFKDSEFFQNLKDKVETNASISDSSLSWDVPQDLTALTAKAEQSDKISVELTPEKILIKDKKKVSRIYDLSTIEELKFISKNIKSTTNYFVQLIINGTVKTELGLESYKTISNIKAYYIAKRINLPISDHTE